MKRDCKYFSEHMKGDSIGDDFVFLFQGEVMCHILNCKNNNGKYLIEEGDWVGYCVSKDIEEGNPIDKGGDVIDLEKITNERDLLEVDLCVYNGIKPMNPKTGNTEPYFESKNN